MAGAPEQPHECGTTLHGLSPARISAATDAMDAEHGGLAGSSCRSTSTSLLLPSSSPRTACVAAGARASCRRGRGRPLLRPPEGLPAGRERDKGEKKEEEEEITDMWAPHVS